MSVLDATWICSRGSQRFADPAVWATPVPVRTRIAAQAAEFSWRSLARNPQALLMTGMLSTLVVRDAVAGVLAR